MPNSFIHDPYILRDVDVEESSAVVIEGAHAGANGASQLIMPPIETVESIAESTSFAEEESIPDCVSTGSSSIADRDEGVRGPREEEESYAVVRSMPFNTHTPTNPSTVDTPITLRERRSSIWKKIGAGALIGAGISGFTGTMVLLLLGFFQIMLSIMSGGVADFILTKTIVLSILGSCTGSGAIAGGLRQMYLTVREKEAIAPVQEEALSSTQMIINAHMRHFIRNHYDNNVSLPPPHLPRLFPSAAQDSQVLDTAPRARGCGY